MATVASGKVRGCIEQASYASAIFCGRGLTLRCTGKPTAAFSGCGLPVNSNVRPLMNQDQFVQSLKSFCRDAAVADCVASFEHPPGRRPTQALAQLSRWFLGLQPADREL